MEILNTTYNIHETRVDEWLEWMQHEYIVGLRLNGVCVRHVLTRILIDEEMGGITFSLQLYVNNATELLQAPQGTLAHYDALLDKRFAGQYVMFRTPMQLISGQ